MTRPLSDEWRGWLRLNFERGCAVDDLYHRATRRDFDPDEVSRELGGYRPGAGATATSEPAGTAPDSRAPSVTEEKEPWFSLYHAPLTRPENSPRAWRLDTELAQVYEIPDLLTGDECEAMIEVIDSSLRRSTTTRGPADYRTSRTCGLRRAAPETIAEIDRRLAGLIGCDVAFSEPMQGQRYDPGEYFKGHTDWFASGTKEYGTYTKTGGQRTWTVMIYLNDVEAGGETRFEKIGRAFRPVKGLGVAWNNLGIDGVGNRATFHEAMPVTQGQKYIITKWFREREGLNV